MKRPQLRSVQGGNHTIICGGRSLNALASH